MSILIAYLIIGLVFALGSALDEHRQSCRRWALWMVWVPLCTVAWPCMLLIGYEATGLRYQHYDWQMYRREQSDSALYDC